MVQGRKGQIMVPTILDLKISFERPLSSTLFNLQPKGKAHENISRKCTAAIHAYRIAHTTHTTPNSLHNNRIYLVCQNQKITSTIFVYRQCSPAPSTTPCTVGTTTKLVNNHEHFVFCSLLCVPYIFI